MRLYPVLNVIDEGLTRAIAYQCFQEIMVQTKTKIITTLTCENRPEVSMTPEWKPGVFPCPVARIREEKEELVFSPIYSVEIFRVEIVLYSLHHIVFLPRLHVLVLYPPLGDH